MRPHFSFNKGDIRIQFPCPLCEKRGENTLVSILDQSKQHLVAHILCKECESGFLANMLMRGSEVACMTVLSDLSAPEAKRSLSSLPVSMEEVLSTEQALERGGFA